jgi:hypothetical protein
MLKRKRAGLSALVLPTSTTVAGNDDKNSLVQIAKRILEKNSEFKKAFLAVLDDLTSITNKSAQLIIMGFEMWQEDKKITFAKKPDGVSGGFVVNKEGRKLFVKSFLNNEVSGGSQINEIFVYRLLLELGLGAEVEARVFEGRVPFLLSKDLSESGGKVSFGEVAENIISAKKSDDECVVSVIRLELLARLLGLGDACENEGNYGVVVHDDGKLKPVVVDFHFDLLPELAASATASSGNELENIIKEIADNQKGGFLVGLTQKLVGGKINVDLYSKVLKGITPEILEAAISKSLGYCNSFVSNIGDDQVKAKFGPDDMKEYAEKVRSDFGKLREQKNLKPHTEVKSQQRQQASSPLLDTKGAGDITSSLSS